MKFDIDNYKGRYAMRCKTRKEAEDFCTYLHSVGRKWHTGKGYDEMNGFDYYGDAGVYCFNRGYRESIFDATFNGYNILEWSAFMNKSFSKANLKTGDIIKRRNGSVAVVLRDSGVLLTLDGPALLGDICEDLTYRHQEGENPTEANTELDIVAVRRPTKPEECGFDAFEKECGELVYKREDVETMTLEDVCAALGKKIKIVDSE